MINIHFVITPEDKPYLSFLNPILRGKANVSLTDSRPDTITEVIMKATSRGASKYIATSSPKLLQLLLGARHEPTIDDYAGSIIERNGWEFLILDPLEHLITKTWGKFIYERYFSKFLNAASWLQVPEFSWKLFEARKAEYLLGLFSSAILIGCDIETARNDPDRIINCISFSALQIDYSSNSYRITTVVVPFTDVFNITFAKAVCWLPVAKVFQNGKYDHAYLLRYGIATYNYAFDTINMFHSWYSELPKDLAFITTFALRKWEYWKDEGKTGDLYDYYQYNAKDSFVTVVSALALLREMPDWALRNFLEEFPLVFPCMLAENTGIKCDVEAMRDLGRGLTATYEEHKRRLRVMVATPGFNPGSPQQVGRLFVALGSGDIKKTGKIARDKVGARHPLNKRILSSIEAYRTNKKLDSGYIDEEKLWNGRIFYALNPHGTDTGRLASKESQFWCGLQIQNIPRDRKDFKIKYMFVADNGFLFGEGDYKQNETYGTAYLSGDLNLIAAISDPTKDFHGRNAASFFGVPYESIVHSYQDSESLQWLHDTIDNILRDLSKRTNHGANYNMGDQVMLDTMGIENVLRAKKLLKLPAHWPLLKVTGYLLKCFADTYPVVKGPWYDKCKDDVRTTRMLVGPTGWTRYCFGDPDKNKRHLNAYVAHPPQSLGAKQLNRAYMNVFNNVALPNPDDFKLGPQIHDSILFQYRFGREDLAYAVKREMEIETSVRDTFGIVRTLKVPVDLKGGAQRWSDVKKLRIPVAALAPSLALA